MARPSVTSASRRVGRISSWRPSAAPASSVPNCPHPPKTRRRTVWSAGATSAIGDPRDPRALLARAGGTRQDVPVVADDPRGLLQHLHPLNVVVAGVREVREAERPYLPNHPGHRFLHRDAGREPEYPLGLRGGDPVAADEAVLVIDVDVRGDPGGAQGTLRPQGQLGDAEVAGR